MARPDRSRPRRPSRAPRRHRLGAELDIRDLRCPLTWVRTKLTLEAMAPGEELVVRCPPGETLENVPRSAREAGHAVTVAGDVVRIVK